MVDLAHIFSQFFPHISLPDALLLFLLIFTRWLVMSMMMPFLGAELLPSVVRIALCALLSAICFIMLADKTHQDFTIFVIACLFLKELLLGFILGFLASLIFYCYELFGELVDLARAASMSKLLLPQLKHQSSPMGVLLFQLSLIVFLSLGLHRPVLTGAFKSFVIFPPLSLNTPLLSDNVLSIITSIISTLFEIALSFALPIIVVCFLIDIAFGLLNRVAPQINAYFLSLPAKMMGGLVILFIMLPFLLDDFAQHSQNLTQFFWRFLGIDG